MAKRGGKRAGSGRKRIWNEPMKVVRIPRRLDDEFKKWLRGRGYSVKMPKPPADSI